MLKKILFSFFVILIVAGVGAGVFLYQARTAKSTFVGEKVFHIEAGEDITSIAERLESERLVVSRWYFLWSAWRGGLRGKVHAGDFVILGKLSAPEVAVTLLSKEGKPMEVTLTFPEGWDAKKMAARLSVNRFDGEGWLALVNDPSPDWRVTYPILSSVPIDASLEGFLFPDTYTFRLDATPRDILEKMLRNFETRFGDNLRLEAIRQGKSVFDVVILASILEREIGTANQSAEVIERDRKMVSDLFWRRLADNHALESCATVQFVLGTNKPQLSFEETRTDSPYNTYINTGLPPGPIGNPGLVSLRATLFPTANDFYFFLNNPQTGETFFAKTFEEHQRNKSANGL